MSMAGPQADRTLKKLVSLKRQRAEQVHALAIAELRAEERRLAALEAEMSALDPGQGDYADFVLAMKFGRAAFLKKPADAVREVIGRKKQALQEAREALKKAIHSEGQLASG